MAKIDNHVRNPLAFNCILVNERRNCAQGVQKVELVVEMSNRSLLFYNLRVIEICKIEYETTKLSMLLVNYQFVNNYSKILVWHFHYNSQPCIIAIWEHVFPNCVAFATIRSTNKISYSVYRNAFIDERTMRFHQLSPKNGDVSSPKAPPIQSHQDSALCRIIQPHKKCAAGKISVLIDQAPKVATRSTELLFLLFLEMAQSQLI
ncbi:hypothetical protein EGR_09282 [Echinococcus granulosus]|uniref:Uncharacterized protein n=1 Tax=Echinococcus granulosus TaxID=6210 RepID=W6UR35_ECHGR|nr:hypothetical protein EGR_09282 [Echinococcus granulosus]EUB55879.1 hypothetical protein EGR_09282 [Echinococcus granulosus]